MTVFIWEDAHTRLLITEREALTGQSNDWTGVHLRDLVSFHWHFKQSSQGTGLT